MVWRLKIMSGYLVSITFGMAHTVRVGLLYEEIADGYVLWYMGGGAMVGLR